MDKEKRYQTVAELPEWARDTVQKLIANGGFANSVKLDLSEDMLRMFVINDRMGVY